MRREKIKAKAKQVKKYIPAVFIAMKDKATPVGAKILATITVVYAWSPAYKDVYIH